ncbi:MAG: hypothetical protein Q9211_006921, partial [Gyalolechia sp. 1 TL-2023]
MRSKTDKQRDAGGLNNAYRDMLVEAEADSLPTQTGDEKRPIKRRRVRGHIITGEGVATNQIEAPSSKLKPATEPQGTPEKDHDPASVDDYFNSQIGTAANQQLHREQTALKDESSDESDFAWEEVDLAQDADQPYNEPTAGDEDGELNLVLDGNMKNGREETAAARRKPLTAAERKLRLEIHKLHLLCLLSHVHLHNHWCNDQNVH